MRSSMMRALGLSSGVRTQKRPLGWICIIWFISTLDVTAGNDIKLYTTSWKVFPCGSNVVLLCEFTGIKEEDIIEFFWMEKEMKLCEYVGSQSANKTQFLCESASMANYYRLRLTIMGIMPDSEGTYHCKLHSKRGSANEKTIVRLEECIDKSHSSVSESDAECTFTGVYPLGKVNWTLGGTELTDVTTTQKKEADGRFTVKSKVKKRKENTNELYTCSLWLPTDTVEQMHMVANLTFSGSGVVKLTWICMLVEMVLLILVIQF